MPIDRERIESLRDLMGGDGPLREIIDLYESQGDETMGVLKSALAAGDAPAIRNAAHKLRSAALYLGMPAVDRLCKDIEVRNAAPDYAPGAEDEQQIQALDDAFRAGMAALQDFA